MGQGKRKKRKAIPQHPAHPYHWGQWLALAALWLLARLPWRAALALGRATGGALYYLGGERRAIARLNLQVCFPDETPAWRERLVRANWQATGRAVAETALAWYGGSQVERIPVRVTGEEHLHAARERGLPVIAMSGHLLSIELSARLLPEHIPLVVIYKPMKRRPVLDRAMLAARRRNLHGAMPRNDIRRLVRALRDGNVLWYAGDQDYRGRHRVMAPFFGHPAATVTALGRLARMSHAAVIPLFFFREADGSYLIEFQPALEGFPSGDDVADATRMNQILEAAIRRYPEQYLWMHRRFKRRDDGSASPYEQG
ncbi:MAG: lipid A biosynthesis acyltransferase [Ectothiorhodospiraceae bacterium]